MAKQNTVFLLARVVKRPVIAKNRETNEFMHGLGYVHVVRGVRDAHDEIRYVKHDYPLILSKDAYILNQMLEWRENDIVQIKGILVSKDINKEARCPDPNCLDPDGKGGTKNTLKGTILYINPIETLTIKRFGKGDDAKKEAITFLMNKRELSNQAYFIGTVIKQPQIFKTKKGTTICQYQVAINRKYHIRTDDPTIRRDWPYIKSYGSQALEDKLRLKIGTDVYIDGFIQARKVIRHVKCKCCGKFFDYVDHSMEIVPFAVEYGKFTYRTDEEIIAEKHQSIEDIKQSIFDGLYKEDIKEEDKKDIPDDVDKNSYNNENDEENDKKD
ncbi:MAG: single-stranded DNA-binding protein [Candidatus Weimeria sp.]